MSVIHLAGEQLEQLLKSDEPKLFLWKQSTEGLHTVIDVPSCGYIRTRDKEYSCAFLHADDEQSNTTGYHLKNCFTFGIKELLNLGLIKGTDGCVDLGYYIDPPELHPLVEHYKRTVGNTSVNNIVPLTKHIEMWSNFEFDIDYYWNNAKEDIRETANIVWNTMIPQLFSEIEREGLTVDIQKFVEHYPDKIHLINIGHKVYTHYNFYTKTGRPSNAFGGINFAAMNKHDGTRDVFVVGEKNSIFVNVDFRSYHLHIIAKLTGVNLSDDPHTMLAKQYFNTDTVTPEQYEESKKITFRNLYDTQLGPEVKDIEIFKKAKEMSHKLWNGYLERGHIYSRLGKLFTFDEELTENKVFNYYIQMTETEMNVAQMHSLWWSTGHIPCLYTYDSMVFEIPEHHLDELKKDLKQFLVFPYTIEVGKTLSF